MPDQELTNKAASAVLARYRELRTENNSLSPREAIDQARREISQRSVPGGDSSDKGLWEGVVLGLSCEAIYEGLISAFTTVQTLLMSRSVSDQRRDFASVREKIELCQIAVELVEIDPSQDFNMAKSMLENMASVGPGTEPLLHMLLKQTHPEFPVSRSTSIVGTGSSDD